MKSKKIERLILKESNNTSLIGIIGVLLIFVSSVGNAGADFSTIPKASILENRIAGNSEKINLSIGNQTIIIEGKEYNIEITPKY